MVYKDHLIEINEFDLILFHYYFPSGREKRISLTQIERVFVYLAISGPENGGYGVLVI